ncbi:UBX domain-containing protein 1-B-like protein [Leptotrombidium deliense]|uniref:UBX domain-containing protein 1-B-like protein n=1 Tax=Leptotrombidium deliense TaxID=299467 RepID=A0A443SE76_9ACAR|nr:UBX domain-containing protein 1-B-like protein [Leptotrombidium deliense]
MSSMNDYITQQLKEMGFDENKIKKALEATKAESVEEVMEWIITHEDCSDEHSSIQQQPKVEDGVTDDLKVVQEAKEKERTDEEKELERKRYEDLIKQRRLEREEKEKKEEIEKEKTRRKTGCEVSKLREKMETEERIRLAEELRRDKLETQAHKQAILEQIRRDREAQKMKNNPIATPVVPIAHTVSSTTTSTAANDHTNCRLAIRLPTGQTLQQQFSSKEQLASVRLYIQMNRPDKPFNESQLASFDLIFPPNRRFTDEEMEKSLSELGLCPSARLTVSDRK